MDIQKYIDEYISWLRSEISFQKTGEYYEITSPFLDPNNDYLQLYVKQEGDKICFSDDGYTINALKSHGLTLTPNRKAQLTRILSQYGLTLSKTELILKAPVAEFPVRKHLFVQAMLRVCDLFMTSRTKAETIFTDDINRFLESKEIYCTPNIMLMGKTGFSHNYDFVMQRSKNKPTRFCIALNTPTRSYMESALFSWSDTKSAREDASQLIVFLNDKNPIQQGIEAGFNSYDAKTIRWSQKDISENLELLSA